MKECELIKVCIPVGVNLFVDQCPKTHEEEKYMSRVPYVSVVGSLMYAMVWTRLEIYIIGDLQAGMCLTCLEEQSVG
jgi:hypothetical protein